MKTCYYNILRKTKLLEIPINQLKGLPLNLVSIRILFFFIMSLIFSTNSLYSLDIKLNYGKENKESFAVLNVRNNYPFACESHLKINGDVEKIICKINGIPQSGFNATKSSMLSFSYHMENNPDDPSKKIMVVEVLPLNGSKLQLFSVFSDLKTEKPIPVTRKVMSKSYQIVAYRNKIPFLHPEDNLANRDSINFPVSIPDTATPMINELDINRKPLDYIVGKDLETFLDIRSLMHERKYMDALEKIAKALKTYPDSLFTKDMIYYAIIALSKTKNKDSQNYLIESATKWVKMYASDDKVPEVMYLLGKTLMQQNKAKDALYYLNRIIEEYPQTKYSSLAKMQVANTLKSQSDVKRAPLIYREAYKEAQDIDTASQVAIAWARFNLRGNNFEHANELFEKVFKVFPAYFLEDKDESLNIIDELEDKEQYQMAANIAQYLSGYVNVTDDVHAKLLDKASEFYAKAGDFDAAHKMNLDFLYYHPGSKLVDKIKERDNALLFEVSGDYKTKMQRYDNIIANYPNTESAKKALLLKAQLYLDNKQYDEIIKMQSLLPKDSTIVQTAINNEVLKYLEEKNCDGVAGVLSRASKVTLTVSQSLDAFECLYNQTAYQKANELFSGLNKYIKDGENQLRWLYLSANTLFALGENRSALKASKDVMDLAFATGNTQYYDIMFKMFNAYYNDENTRYEAIKLGAKMKQLFPDDKRMLEVHFTLLNEAQHKKDALATKSEAANLLALQDKVKDYNYSPYVNFVYANSLLDEGNYNEALIQLNAIAKFPLSLDDKQQRLYKIANINYTLKNMDASKQNLEECVKLGNTTSWGTLCNNALTLHNNGYE